MPLVDARGYQLVPDIGSGLRQGAQTFSQLQSAAQQRELQQHKIEQARIQQQQLAQQQALLGRAFPGMTGQPQQIPETSIPMQEATGAQPVSRGTPGIIQDDRALAEFAIRYPDRFEKIKSGLGLIDEQKSKSAADWAFRFENAPASQRPAMIRQRIAEIEARGGNANDTRQLEGMTVEQQNQAARVVQMAALSPEKRLEIAQGKTPTIKAGVDELGAGFFALTPEGAQRIPGAAPQPKAPLVSIGGKGDQKELEELAKIRAKSYEGIQERGRAADEQIASLDILDSIDVSTGAAEPMKQALADFGSVFGVNTDDLANVAAGQAFTSEAGKVVLRVMATQKGPQTDQDFVRIRRTITDLGNRPEANKFINNAARAHAMRSIEQRTFYENWLAENETLKGADKAWNAKKRNVPIVSKHLKTPEGLPVFYFRFKERVQQANPDATEAEIIAAWKQQDKLRK